MDTDWFHCSNAHDHRLGFDGSVILAREPLKASVDPSNGSDSLNLKF